MIDGRRDEGESDGRGPASGRAGALGSLVWPREAPRVLLGLAVLEHWSRSLLRAAGAARQRPVAQPVTA